MSFAETQKLIVDLSLGGNFTSQLKTAQKGLGSFGATLDKTGNRGYKAGQQIGTGIKNAAKLFVVASGLISGVLVKAVKDGQDAAKVQEIYANAIKNSGKVSSEYVGILNKQQEALLQLGGVDDELIKAEQTRLIQMGLTGKRVAQLTPLILDVAKATGKDLLTVTTAVGKAANGQTTALARLGIVIPKTKDKTKAYALVVKELTDRFGGATKALSGDFSTRLAVFREELANVSEDVGQKLLPSLTKIVDVAGRQLVPAFASFVNSILPDVISGLDKVATFLEKGGATRAIAEIKPVLDSFASTAKLTGQVIQTAVKAFLSLPPEIQKVAVGALAINKLTGGLVTNVAGGLAEQFLQRGASPANPLWVQTVGGGLGGAAEAAGAAGAIGTGTALVAIAAAVAVSVIATLPFADKNNALKQQGLSPADIAATKFANSSIAAQQNAIKHGYGPNGVSTGSVVNLGKAADDIYRATHPFTDFAHHAGKALDDLAISAGIAQRNLLHALTREEAKILGGLDPRAGHAFKTAQRTYIQTHTNRNAATIADDVTKRFTIGGTKFTSDQKNAVNELRALKGLQARFLARGDTKTAGRIGRDIAHMRQVLAGKVGTVKSAIDRKKLSIKPTFNVKIPVSLDGRELGAALARFQTLHETSGGD